MDIKNTAPTVEYSLEINAFFCCTLPIKDLFDKDQLSLDYDTIKKSHIYIIGYSPFIEVEYIYKTNQFGQIYTVLVFGKPYEIHFPLSEEDDHSFPDDITILRALNEQHHNFLFYVKYIGQAYGKNGSRNAINRLPNHEKLLEICVKVPIGYCVTILLLEIDPDIKVNAIHKIKNEEPLDAGIDKLYGTINKEHINLYEAALIGYFEPEYNAHFKDSFPSKKLKTLAKCYENNISTITVNLDDFNLPFHLFSEEVESAPNHVAEYVLPKKRTKKASNNQEKIALT